MADPGSNPTSGSTPRLVEDRSAHFVYFDVPSAFGALNGIIQIELVANILMPAQGGGLEVKTVPTARLRCSAVAARALRETLDDALKTIDQPGQKPAGEGPDTTFN